MCIAKHHQGQPRMRTGSEASLNCMFSDIFACIPEFSVWWKGPHLHGGIGLAADWAHREAHAAAQPAVQRACKGIDRRPAWCILGPQRASQEPFATAAKVRRRTHRDKTSSDDEEVLH